MSVSLFCPCSPAGNEPCPQPQTSEHLAAIEIMKLKHILILQNKIDLVKESQAKEQYEQILAFVQGEWCTGRLRLATALPPTSQNDEYASIASLLDSFKINEVSADAGHFSLTAS